MKKRILFIAIAFVFASTSLFAQWNNTGDSKTTGSLTVGSDVDNRLSKLTILGPMTPSSDSNLRDISFNFNVGGESVIRARRGGAWKSSSLEFLTTSAQGDLYKRLHFADWGAATYLYDKRIELGIETPDFVQGEGSILVFGGTHQAAGYPFIAKYAKTPNSSDMRIGIGWGIDNRFVVGRDDYQGYTSLFTVSNSGNVGIGIENAANKLEVNGIIRAKEVRVESGWADFVFKKEYDLPTLQEVKAHIDEHKRLPGIPSEAEVKENGVGLAEISTKLLQKVEELTLYAIQQNEAIENYNELIRKLNDRISELEKK